MEGNLLKWTNYWMGWQLRWFVLKDGVLSYYNNQNESKSGGCKRSFKIFLFDIIVNKNDNTRVDLIVANDQHLYLKACDYKERQKWLVALASQKASYPGSSVILNNNNLKSGILQTSGLNSLVDQNSSISTSGDENKNKISLAQQHLTPFDTTNLLKIKQSELRLYCDLLQQQTHEMKNLVISIKSSIGLPENGLKMNISGLKLESMIIVRNTEGDLNSINCHKTKNNSNENVSPASSFKSLNEDILLNQLEPSVSNEESNDLDTSNENVKKMDDITSNINITCDMLIQIIRNLVVLSNTSSNISPAAVSSLLEETSNNTLPSMLSNSFDDLSKYQYHLYHPLHNNSQLNQFKMQSSLSENISNPTNEK